MTKYNDSKVVASVPEGWVAHTPYLAERIADRRVLVQLESGHIFCTGIGSIGLDKLSEACHNIDYSWPIRKPRWIPAASINYPAVMEYWKRRDGVEVRLQNGYYYAYNGPVWSIKGFDSEGEAKAFADQQWPLED